MTMKNKKTSVLKIDVKKMFMNYYNNSQKDFENEVYTKLKKRGKLSKVQLDTHFPKTKFMKMLYSDDDDLVDIVFENDSDFWVRKIESEFIKTKD